MSVVPPLGQNDWDDLVAYARWFAKPDKGDYVTGAASFAPTDEFRQTFPVLTRLLSNARTAIIEVHEKTYQMWAWTNAAGKSYGWVGPLPELDAEKRADLHPVHRVLLGSFGGITETWNGADDTNNNWLVNLNWALGAEQSGDWATRYDDYFDFYLDVCEEEKVEPVYAAITMTVFAREANGDLRLYEMVTSRPYHLSHDHADRYITTAPDAPDYTFHVINDCETLQEWVEIIAAQWAVLQGDENG